MTFSVLASLLAALSIVGLGAMGASSIIDARLAPLRIAINPWPGYEFATLARETGFFAEEGVDVRLVELGSLSDCRRAYETGQVDGFFGTPVEMLLASAHANRRTEVAMVVDYSEGADVILARPPIANVNDLRGKRVGLENGTVTTTVLARALALSGLTWNDVRPVYCPATEMPKAFARGEIDAAVIYPPIAIQLKKEGDCREIFSTRQIPGEIVDILAIDSETANQRSHDVQAFVRAFHRAQEYTERHPEIAYQIMADRQRISAEEFRATLDNGVQIVDRMGQAQFLRPDGKLSEVLAAAEESLRLTWRPDSVSDVRSRIPTPAPE